jgi:hypothetical protein
MLHHKQKILRHSSEDFLFVVGGTGLESTALPQAGQKTVQWTVF